MTDSLTHAATVPQPLAWACAAGHCPVIMSDTRPDIAREGELIGIHASRHVPTTADDVACWRALMVNASPWGRSADLPRGALVGVARLVGVVREIRCSIGPAGSLVGVGYELMHGRSMGAPVPLEMRDCIRPWWRSGSKWGLWLADAVLLPEPIPMRGAGGVWFIPSSNPMAPSELAGRALEQWRKARGA